VEAMQTWNDDELLTQFIVALANGAHLVFFAEVFSVGLRELLKRQSVKKVLWYRLFIVFIKR
jgi:hypothetical protein